ncbi:MAG: hypothetical protein JOZ67_08645 [Gammaproteobacteria bacterium]|nr:hypothetical protein [Gammaproteobacteria bacterium]MBV9697308.1 hypothetical protein [Gammaproteobacteria bacterium]
MTAFVFLALLTLVGGCASTTTFTSIWRAPDAQGVSVSGKTVVAVFISRDESQRRAAEDTLAADLTARGAHGIPAYTLLPTDERGSGERARERFREAGANGVVTMRVVGKDQRVTYTPGYVFPPYYGGFGPYWGYGWDAAYDPGYLQTDTLVSVETLVYSLDRDKLLWASTSRTVNPSDIYRLVKEVADSTSTEMARQGFLAGAPQK